MVVLTLAIFLFVAGVLFTLYPILPGTLFVLAGILVYGAMEGWAAFPLWFWIVQAVLIALNFLTDWVASVLGIKRVGGSKQAIWGTTLGLIIGPLLLGPIGILAGPVLGAIIGELIQMRQAGQIARVAVASLIGFLLGIMVKFVLVLIQITLFAVQVWK
ncbi:DUF456 domain-containing protein [Effusibacillus lacus]|nr:DUF456 family protein [Effusibacillus lacus]TCS75838.1 hypothetical protein EDD64_10520 [Effusibacillus lacus]